ncbi:hypothetical protein AB4113_19270, partial [Vibrio breoganii]
NWLRNVGQIAQLLIKLAKDESDWGSSFFNIASFLSTEIRDTITLYRPNWLNFNSDNYPAR